MIEFFTVIKRLIRNLEESIALCGECVFLMYNLPDLFSGLSKVKGAWPNIFFSIAKFENLERLLKYEGFVVASLCLLLCDQTMACTACKVFCPTFTIKLNSLHAVMRCNGQIVYVQGPSLL